MLALTCVLLVSCYSFVKRSFVSRFSYQLASRTVSEHLKLAVSLDGLHASCIIIALLALFLL
jgi:hypothetical protein